MFRIMKTNEFLKNSDSTSSIFYRAACDCNQKTHDIDMLLEFDKDFNDITLYMWMELDYASYYETNNWFLEIWYRIKNAIKLLFIGRIKVNGEFLFSGETQINDFIAALNFGKEELKKIKNGGQSNEKN